MTDRQHATRQPRDWRVAQDGDGECDRRDAGAAPSSTLADGGDWPAVRVGDDRYRVGTVVDFGPSTGDRSGEVWVLTAITDGAGAFAAVTVDGPRPPPLTTEEVRSAWADDDVHLYEVSPRYPPVGTPATPGDPALASLPVLGGGSTAGNRGASGDREFDPAFERAFDLGQYSAAFDRRPEDAVDATAPRILDSVTVEDVLYAEDPLRDRGVDPDVAGAAVDHARAFARETTTDCPRVAVPATGEDAPFASVPFVHPRVTRGRRLDGRGSALPSFEHPPVVPRAYRQAWHSPRYEVTLSSADYRRGSVTVRVAEAPPG